MSDVTPGGAAELDGLPSKELYERAMALAKERRDVGFLWELLRAIPAAAASLGEVGRAQFDMVHGLSLLEEFTHAGEGELADALRPLYIRYLAEHANGT
ncbi:MULTISPECIES: hypothetical protein [Actinomadura]|uniref:Uncharacterized protein n=1 Tax=Actinomadura livida TaxID=79909 RepID=A0A7W7IC16_9ACTN|nr:MULTISPECIES: hypothetical protein [Actinomadura]MBB4774294.1 hypothetical protein [Actinomadura catellatispora]TDB95222.1 hypothetical protein E1266_14005 [Actinomadura sp. 7K534]GGT83598.1 hypothetical protein GCM10010208_02560 [Actinomadura livida]